MTDSVGGVPPREEPLRVDDSDRASDRFEEATLAARDSDLDSDDVQDGSDAVDVWREWLQEGATTPIALRSSRGR